MGCFPTIHAIYYAGRVKRWQSECPSSSEPRDSSELSILFQLTISFLNGKYINMLALTAKLDSSWNLLFSLSDMLMLEVSYKLKKSKLLSTNCGSLC